MSLMQSKSEQGDVSPDAFVLLIEDDPDDIHVIKRVLDRAPIHVKLTTCAHGREALDLLDEKAGADGEKMPDLILLDLNMPVMDGNMFLKALRQHPSCASLPVCVFTTSSDDEIVRRAYEDGANAVVNKVDSLDGMSQVINTIIDFWFRTAKRYYV